MEGKVCTQCGKWKEYSEYGKNPKSRDGLTYQCKTCKAIRGRKYRKANPEKKRARGRKYRAENREKIREKGRRRRVSKLNAEVSHTVEEWLELVTMWDVCPCCGKPWSEVGPPTRDHIVPLTREGATDDISGIQPLCQSCNSKKRNHHATNYMEMWENDSDGVRVRKDGWEVEIGRGGNNVKEGVLV